MSVARRLILSAVTLLISVSGAGATWRPEYAQASPELGRWYADQRNPLGVTCCSDADGAKASEDIRPDPDGTSHYWVRFTATTRPWDPAIETYGDQIEVDSGWIKVPEEAVIKDGKPNPVGGPVIWYYFSGGGSDSGLLRIRCFKPDNET